VALVIETGAGLSDADSYATVAQFKARAAELGASVPTQDKQCEILLRKAMQKLQRNDEWKGYRATKGQALDFPRVGIIIDGFGYSSTELPAQLIEAQILYALTAASGIDLLPIAKADASGPVIESTVGPITTRYAQSPYANRTPIVHAAEVVLQPLLRTSPNNIAVHRA
jgi:hypothetical protein